MISKKNSGEGKYSSYHFYTHLASLQLTLWPVQISSLFWLLVYGMVVLRYALACDIAHTVYYVPYRSYYSTSRVQLDSFFRGL